jgi:hypothetical protein
MIAKHIVIRLPKIGKKRSSYFQLTSSITVMKYFVFDVEGMAIYFAHNIYLDSLCYWMY